LTLSIECSPRERVKPIVRFMARVEDEKDYSSQAAREEAILLGIHMASSDTSEFNDDMEAICREAIWNARPDETPRERRERLLAAGTRLTESLLLSVSMQISFWRCFPEDRGAKADEKVGATLERFQKWLAEILKRFGNREILARKVLEIYLASGRGF
jgi:hypothetical protein